MPSQHEIRQQITSQIVEALKRGTAPWRRPWSVDKNAGLPANAVSRRRFRERNDSDLGKSEACIRVPQDLVGEAQQKSIRQ